MLERVKMIMVHLGDQAPDHFWKTVEHTRKYFNGTLYLIIPEADCGDRRIMQFNAVAISTKSLEDKEKIRNFKDVNFMESYGAFWSHALMRLAYIEQLMWDCKLENTVHIENDVLIYEDPNTQLHNYQRLYPNHVVYNLVGPRYCSFAYVYIANSNIMSMLNHVICNYMKLGHDLLKERIGEDMVNEMMLLKLAADDFPAMIEIFPSGLKPPCNQNLEELNAIYDGASIGQYLFGTPGQDNVGWMGDHHYFGQVQKHGKYKFHWIKDSYGRRNPFIEDISSGNIIRVASLHMHCKKMELGM